jgi:hypothetical protein
MPRGRPPKLSSEQRDELLRLYVIAKRTALNFAHRLNDLYAPDWRSLELYLPPRLREIVLTAHRRHLRYHTRNARTAARRPRNMQPDPDTPDWLEFETWRDKVMDQGCDVVDGPSEGLYRALLGNPRPPASVHRVFGQIDAALAEMFNIAPRTVRHLVHTHPHRRFNCIGEPRPGSVRDPRPFLPSLGSRAKGPQS